MARPLGRPAEKERGEMVIIENPSMLQLAEAAKALYDWVGERKDNTVKVERLMSTEYTQGYNRGGKTAYAKTVTKMQTLFAGLIDFEQKQEKQKNGL